MDSELKIKIKTLYRINQEVEKCECVVIKDGKSRKVYTIEFIRGDPYLIKQTERYFLTKKEFKRLVHVGKT